MIQLTKTIESCLGGRCGTAAADEATMFAKLGIPTEDYRDTLDEFTYQGKTYTDKPKVTLCWRFKTPRGIAEVRDYWWNAPGEWSIAAARRKPAMWLAKYLRQNGIKASSKAWNLAALNGDRAPSRAWGTVLNAARFDSRGERVETVAEMLNYKRSK